MTEWCVRYIKRGKAHRIASGDPHVGIRSACGHTFWLPTSTAVRSKLALPSEVIPVGRVDVSDRCRRCWSE